MSRSRPGPYTTKKISGASTGLSDEAVSFLTAYCSPFTNPRDLPAEPKVPDPRSTEMSNTAFIWAKMDITPVYNVATGAYESMVMTSADPFAPCPVAWAKSYNETDTFSTGTGCLGYKTPNSLAADYEDVGIDDIIAKTQSIALRAKQYRIVGHGLKCFVSRNTNIQRGTMEAGQYSIASSINATAKNPSSRAGIGQLWPWAPGVLPQHGAQATMMQSAGLSEMRKSILNAKEQEYGFFQADEGAVVRWTDSNEFHWQPMILRSMAYPLENAYKIYFQPLEEAEYDPSTLKPSGYNQGRAYPTHTEYNTITGAAPATADVVASRGVNRLCSLEAVGNEGSYYTFSDWSNTAARNFYYKVQPNGTSTFDTLTNDYLKNPDSQFNKGLYIDLKGFAGSQVISVQVCWHIEFMPTNSEPWYGSNSPVDLNFDALTAMGKDRHAFPIVQAGGAFFTDFQSAIARALNPMLPTFARATDESDLASSLERRNKYRR